MARKKGTKARGKAASKKPQAKSLKRTTAKAKRASRETKKSAKQIARTAKTLKSAVKKLTKTFSKTQQQKAGARELAQINRLLGEEYQSLSSARRALKRESRPATPREIKADKNKVVKKRSKKPVQPPLKFPHPSTPRVRRFAKKRYGIDLNVSTPNYQRIYDRVVSDPQFQASYGVMESLELRRNKKAHGPYARALEDFGYREDDADYDVGDTPKDEGGKAA